MLNREKSVKQTPILLLWFQHGAHFSLHSAITSRKFHVSLKLVTLRYSLKTPLPHHRILGFVDGAEPQPGHFLWTRGPQVCCKCTVGRASKSKHWVSADGVRDWSDVLQKTRLLGPCLPVRAQACETWNSEVWQTRDLPCLLPTPFHFPWKHFIFVQMKTNTLKTSLSTFHFRRPSLHDCRSLTWPFPLLLSHSVSPFPLCSLT